MDITEETKNWRNVYLDKITHIRNKHDVDKITTLKSLNIGDSIFKYCPLNNPESTNEDYTIINLINDQVWMSNPQEFNDPYDCKINLDLKLLNNLDPNKIRNSGFKLTLYKNRRNIKRAKRKIKKMCNTHLKEDDNLIKMTNIMFEMSNLAGVYGVKTRAIKGYNRLLDLLKVSCFSTRNDSTLMWGHYASGHRGICIEYDINNMKKQGLFDQLHPVSYSDELPKNDLIEAFLNADISNMYAPVLSKSLDWSYEKEIRLIHAKKESIVKVGTPKAIYLGSQIDIENAIKVIKTCIEKDIDYKFMRTSKNNYKIEEFNILEMIESKNLNLKIDRGIKIKNRDIKHELEKFVNAYNEFVDSIDLNFELYEKLVAEISKIKTS